MNHDINNYKQNKSFLDKTLEVDGYLEVRYYKRTVNFGLLVRIAFFVNKSSESFGSFDSKWLI